MYFTKRKIRQTNLKNKSRIFPKFIKSKVTTLGQRGVCAQITNKDFKGTATEYSTQFETNFSEGPFIPVFTLSLF